MNSNFRTLSTPLEPSATGKVSWVQTRTQWKKVSYPRTIHRSVHPSMVVWLWVLVHSGQYYAHISFAWPSIIPFLVDSSKRRSGHKTSGEKWSFKNKQFPFLVASSKGQSGHKTSGEKWSLEKQTIEPRPVQHILFRSKLFLVGLVEVHKCERSSKYLIPYNIYSIQISAFSFLVLGYVPSLLRLRTYNIEPPTMISISIRFSIPWIEWSLALDHSFSSRPLQPLPFLFPSSSSHTTKQDFKLFFCDNSLKKNSIDTVENWWKKTCPNTEKKSVFIYMAIFLSLSFLFLFFLGL